jgi:hypothetical protein
VALLLQLHRVAQNRLCAPDAHTETSLTALIQLLGQLVLVQLVLVQLVLVLVRVLVLCL